MNQHQHRRPIDFAGGLALSLVLFSVVGASASTLPVFGKGREAEAAVKRPLASPETREEDTTIQPTAFARQDIPAETLELYVKAGEEYDVPWNVLAGTGWRETDHGRLDLPGVTSGVNSAGCCSGPMQFNRKNGDKKHPSTWESFRVDGDGDGDRKVFDPVDAIPSAANMLAYYGADQDYGLAVPGAVWHYNHADWYVQQVMGRAARYGRVEDAPAQLFKLPGVTFSGKAAFDVALNQIDPRLVTVIERLAQHFEFSVDIVFSGHCQHVDCSPGRSISLHSLQRAIDIKTVGGSAVSKVSQPSRKLQRWLVSHHRELGLDEIGQPFLDTDDDVFFTSGESAMFHLGFED